MSNLNKELTQKLDGLLKELGDLKIEVAVCTNKIESLHTSKNRLYVMMEELTPKLSAKMAEFSLVAGRFEKHEDHDNSRFVGIFTLLISILGLVVWKNIHG